MRKACGQDEGLSMTLDSKHTETLKRGKRGGGKQGNLELLHSVWIMETPPLQLEQAAGTHCGGALLGIPHCFPWCAGSGPGPGCCFCHAAELKRRTFLTPEHEPIASTCWLQSWLEGWETKTALQCAWLGFLPSKTTSNFQSRYILSSNVPPVKTTSLLLMLKFSCATQLLSSLSKCQTSSLLTHPVPAF